jgi:hypothetical protein
VLDVVLEQSGALGGAIPEDQPIIGTVMKAILFYQPS